MNFEINKAVGAGLGALLFTFMLGLFTEALYSQPAMKKPGYDLPGASAEGHGAAEAKAAEPAVPLPVLLAKADPAKGKDDAKPCTACHDFSKGGAAKVGPPLYGVVGRPKASIAGFNYSDGMKAKGGDWSYDELDHFIASPKTDISGTKMAFAGEKDAAKRAAIIAYLRSLSDNPLPLPAAK
ncbi:MAG: cytochrome c family protein [Hyphomicrobiales bacterium]|nr:cytochrome c family protein [Hyphomicrobiales bacterium]